MGQPTSTFLAVAHSLCDRLDGRKPFPALPTALYGFVLLMTAIGYSILQRTIIAKQGKDSLLAGAIGRDRKGTLSLIFYLVGIGLAFVNQWLADAMYVLVALMWFIPDRRVEGVLAKHHD